MDPVGVVSIEQFERQAAALVLRVEGEAGRIVITRSGMPIAVVVPVADAHFLERVEQAVHRPEALRRLKEVDLTAPLDLEELHTRLRLLLVRPRKR
jgi:prevent-host-death family protein